MKSSLQFAEAVRLRSLRTVLVCSVAVIVACVHGAPPVPGAPARVTAFVDVAVIPMDREVVLNDQTVLVQGGRISVVGPAPQVRVPAGAILIDGRGKFLLPGLADMHAHIFMAPQISKEAALPFYAFGTDSVAAEAKLFLWLANGVTTIRNPDYTDDEHGRQALRLRALAATGDAWLPRIYTAGMWAPNQYLGFDGTKPPVLDSVAKYVAAYKARGYDFLKVHNESHVVLDSVLAAAKRLGIPVAGHVPPPARVEQVLPLGYKSVEHSFAMYLWKNRTEWNSHDTTGFASLAGALRRSGVWHCPTQEIFDRLFNGTEVSGDSPLLLKVERDSGVKLLLGTDDVPWQGVITRELESMVSAGLTPYEALLTGTRNVAEYFGTLGQTGTIAVGKRADMVLLTGNPLRDVRYTAQPAGVMLGGRWLSRDELHRRLDTLKLETFTPGHGMLERLPVKSYWENVADHAMETTTHLLDSLPVSDSLTDKQRSHHDSLLISHWERAESLGDSLDNSDQYVSGTQRIFSLIAQQLGEDRLYLTSNQRLVFDREASKWVQRRKKEGYPVTIPGWPSAAP